MRASKPKTCPPISSFKLPDKHSPYLLPRLGLSEPGIRVSPPLLSQAFVRSVKEDERERDGRLSRRLLNAPQCLSDRANTVRRHNEPTDYIVIVSPQHKRPPQDQLALSITVANFGASANIIEERGESVVFAWLENKEIGVGTKILAWWGKKRLKPTILVFKLLGRVN